MPNYREQYDQLLQKFEDYRQYQMTPQERFLNVLFAETIIVHPEQPTLHDYIHLAALELYALRLGSVSDVTERYGLHEETIRQKALEEGLI